MEMNAGIKIRDDFYDSVQRDLNLSIPETKKVLEANRFLAFDPKLIGEYQRVLKTYKKSKDEVELSHKAWASQPDPCPIPGCPGHKVRTMKPWPWKCSTFGFSHYLAIRCAEHLVPKDAPFETLTVKAKEVLEIWENRNESLQEEETTGL